MLSTLFLAIELTNREQTAYQMQPPNVRMNSQMLNTIVVFGNVVGTQLIVYRFRLFLKSLSYHGVNKLIFIYGFEMLARQIIIIPNLYENNSKSRRDNTKKERK